MAKPAEVAESVVFVASGVAGFMTGSIIAIDGGSTAGRL
ncbi:MAG: SDR family oxidoreductase [Dongiaceae bacterium]